MKRKFFIIIAALSFTLFAPLALAVTLPDSGGAIGTESQVKDQEKGKQIDAVADGTAQEQATQDHQDAADSADKIPEGRDELSQERANQVTATQQKIILDFEASLSKTVPQIIPKPRNLPGVSVETQRNSIASDHPTSIRDTVLYEILPAALKGLVGFVAICSTIVLMIGGIMFLTAYGNDEKITTAKKAITWGIVGLLITIFSYAIVKIIVNLPLG